MRHPPSPQVTHPKQHQAGTGNNQTNAKQHPDAEPPKTLDMGTNMLIFEATFKAQFMNKLSNTDNELKKSVACKKAGISNEN